jgi:hypothetical protein
VLLLAGLGSLSGQEIEPAPKSAPATYRIPYQLLDTKHVLVRLKLNGAGPFNFIIDTGAPAVFVSTEAAKAANLQADNKGWATVAELEIEGGVKVAQHRVRVEDPFQLLGMNKMNIAGRKLHGMLGYTLLARYRLTFDFTDTHLTWTELSWTPPPPVGLSKLGGKQEAELSAMASFTQFATTLMGRRPDPVLRPRGYLGLELEDHEGQVRVLKVHTGSPAEAAGVRGGDVIVQVDEDDVTSLAELLKQASSWSEGRRLLFKLRRGAELLEVNIMAGKGI